MDDSKPTKQLYVFMVNKRTFSVEDLSDFFYLTPYETIILN